MADNSSNNSDQSPQDGEQKVSTQQIFLIGLLGVVLIIVLVISVLILTRPDTAAEQPTPDQTEIILSPQISPSLTPTNTITPSPRFTFTPKPSRTATIGATSTGTPLPTLLPSLTPAFPSEHNDQYQLLHWTPELATQLIDLMEVYPEALSSFARGADDQGYYDAFQYALFSQKEALHRFPTAPQAQQWLWQLAYNMARTGDPAAGEVYANLITQELNRRVVNLGQLYSWGINQTPEMTIEVISLAQEGDDSSSNLIKVSADENGGSYFWLIEDTGGYESYPLSSDFNFVNPSDVDHFAMELSGIQKNIIGTFPTRVHDSLHYIHPSVFSLIQQPPEKFIFEPVVPPAIGPEFTNHWEPVEPGSGTGDIQFVDAIFPACPVTVKHAYEWHNNALAFIGDSYEINPDPDLLSFCEVVVNHSANVWGMEPTIQLMETLLPIWPPEQTSTGDEYPDDALDEWLYRLSIYHALIGNQEEAVGYAETIVSSPTSPDSRWISPAAEFLDVYQEQNDIYLACFPSKFCDPRLGFQSLVETIDPNDYSDLINTLEEAGVSVRSNGFFDFDNDGESEQWLVIRHHTGSPLEFWIISPTESGIVAVFVETVETAGPRLSYIEPISEPPIVKIDPDITFHFIKQDPDQEPVIIFVEVDVIFASDRTKMELDHLEEMLFTGGDPEFVQAELIVLAKSPHFTCSYLLCPRYLYLLGLASELANDEFSAVAAYLEVWREFLSSPYATMARFKLVSTFTPAPTLTPTNTQSIVLTATGTRTPTGTAASTATSVPATSTSEGYPPPTDPATSYPPPDITTPSYPYP
jgi:hypothetical protein